MDEIHSSNITELYNQIAYQIKWRCYRFTSLLHSDYVIIRESAFQLFKVKPSLSEGLFIPTSLKDLKVLNTILIQYIMSTPPSSVTDP